MFGIGLPELILILAVALVVVGPEKMPELARSLAKGMVELKKAAGALKESLHEEETSPSEPQTPEVQKSIAETFGQPPPVGGVQPAPEPGDETAPASEGQAAEPEAEPDGSRTDDDIGSDPDRNVSP